MTQEIEWSDWRSVIEFIDGEDLCVCLDELTHELASREASDINNGGAEKQVEFISKHLGDEGARAAIKEIIEENLKTCPLCGSRKVITSPDLVGDWYQCRGCGADLEGEDFK